ncbi:MULTISPECIES: NfeD family protein [unclassified Granulicatella]|uniref:NfeD family protein n=1 Tax=unclassified Granulicatella TaxID=2630493 RepID=UPI0010733E7B|nr:MULTISPECIES: NfeD family protein [unclassified Granulicatella]MBF0780491.1 hypothetical protein [Granulicatella sp. 19428wC4_WM01]TFU95350.1 hypothetical protein E4T68_05235 [Granulicatella sp. WM01]
MGIVLLVSAFIGVIIILFSRYFWLGGLVTITSFISYFILFGTGEWIHVIILILGFALMGLELVVPSFGAIGIVGMLMIGLGLYSSSINPSITLFNMSIASVIALTIVLILVKCGYKLQFARGLVLHSRLSSDKGYQAHQKNYLSFIQQKGVSLTSLRPVGKAKINGDEIEVITSGEMIDANEAIVVYKVEGNKILVRRDNHEIR